MNGIDICWTQSDETVTASGGSCEDVGAFTCAAKTQSPKHLTASPPVRPNCESSNYRSNTLREVLGNFNPGTA